MKTKPLAPEDRVYLREALDSAAGRKWMATLIAMRPPISGGDFQQRGLSASEALGYEKAVSNMALLLEDPPTNPELKPIPIRED